MSFPKSFLFKSTSTNRSIPFHHLAQPTAFTAASFSAFSVRKRDILPFFFQLILIFRRQQFLRKPSKMIPTQLCPPISVEARITRLPHTHIPVTDTSESPNQIWQVEVPNNRQNFSGTVIFNAGTVTWASTFPAATAVPSSKPVFAAISAVNPPTFVPSWTMG